MLVKRRKWWWRHFSSATSIPYALFIRRLAFRTGNEKAKRVPPFCAPNQTFPPHLLNNQPNLPPPFCLQFHFYGTKLRGHGPPIQSAMAPMTSTLASFISFPLFLPWPPWPSPKAKSLPLLFPSTLLLITSPLGRAKCLEGKTKQQSSWLKEEGRRRERALCPAVLAPNCPSYFLLTCLPFLVRFASLPSPSHFGSAP
jgi:hypothetical protein